MCTYVKTNVLFCSYLTHYFLEWEMFETKVVEKTKTHISCSITFFEYVINELMWKNFVEPDVSQMTIWCMHIACWIPKAINTHWMCLIVVLYIRCLSCLILDGIYIYCICWLKSIWFWHIHFYSDMETHISN